ncbi:MAG: hypothetical protein M0R77_07900 [Gammaproteobacteria bacterium]|nr:hypothetical protein [Gammaproteobacteria bacterium]
MQKTSKESLTTLEEAITLLEAISLSSKPIEERDYKILSYALREGRNQIQHLEKLLKIAIKEN